MIASDYPIRNTDFEKRKDNKQEHTIYIMKKKKKKTLLHLIIAAAACANLVFLFLFEYALPSTTHAVQAAQRASEERAALYGSSAAEMPAPSPAAAVSGRTEEQSSTEPAEENSVLETADTSDTYTQNTYSQNDTEQEDIAEGEDDSSYGIPSITIRDPLPAVQLADLGNIASVLSDLGYLSADDGYGNDITQIITSDYEAVGGASPDYHITFSVTNSAGRTVSEEREVTVEGGDRPLLELTASVATLPVGGAFYYMDYVKAARDVDGSALDNRIMITGLVDTSSAGTYELTYTVRSRVSNETAEAVLQVTVE